MLDVTPDEVDRVDRADMMGATLGMPAQIERALDAARRASPSFPRPPKNVILAGLGGSAIAGDFLAHLVAREGTVPAVVAREYALPNWADRDTLVICASYSGTTEETLAAFIDAKKRGCMIATASTGGKLEAYAKKMGAPFLPMEAGLQPRAAIGASLVPQAALLESAGVLKAIDGIRDAVPQLGVLALTLAKDVPPDQNEAKRIALALEDHIPFVYASEFMTPVARRWSNQFNENSKILSAWGVMPEMNHNETVGWSGETDVDRFTSVMLRHEREHPQTRERFEFTARAIQARGGRVVQVMQPARSPVHAMLATTLLGDAVSVYLAALRGVDPTPVAIISDLKARVGATGFAAGLDRQL